MSGERSSLGRKLLLALVVAGVTVALAEGGARLLLGAFSTSAAAILWGAGLLYGSWELRRGMVSGRAMLGARLSLGLAMLAREEQLILPSKGTATGSVGALKAASDGVAG